MKEEEEEHSVWKASNRQIATEESLAFLLRLKESVSYATIYNEWYEENY